MEKRSRLPLPSREDSTLHNRVFAVEERPAVAPAQLENEKKETSASPIEQPNVPVFDEPVKKKPWVGVMSIQERVDRSLRYLQEDLDAKVAAEKVEAERLEAERLAQGVPESRDHAVGAPGRPMYNDLATAYSSITSRSSSNNLIGKLPLAGSTGNSKRTDFEQPLGMVPRKMSTARIPAPERVAIRNHGSNAENAFEVDFNISQAILFGSHPPKVDYGSSEKAKPGKLAKALTQNESPSLFKRPLFGNLKKVWDTISSPASKNMFYSPDASRERNERLNSPPTSQSNVTPDFGSSGIEQIGLPILNMVNTSNTSHRQVDDRSSIYHTSQGEAPSGSAPASLSDISNLRSKFHFDEPGTEFVRSEIPENSFNSGLGIGIHPRPEIPDRSSEQSKPSQSNIHNSSLEDDSSTIGQIFDAYSTIDVFQDVPLRDDDGNSENDFVAPLNIGKGTAGQNRETRRQRVARNTNNNGSSMGPDCRKTSGRILIGDFPGQPPSISLPQLPVRRGQGVLPSTSDRFGPSSSYGDTRNLLDFTHRTPGALNNKSHAARIPESRNPYRRSRSGTHQPSPYSTSQAEDNVFGDLSDADVDSTRQALEREVSKALRHKSNATNLSDDSSIRHHGNKVAVPSTVDSIEFFDSDIVLGKKPAGNAADEDGFYAAASIPRTWMGSQHFDRVRIPITQDQEDVPKLEAPLSLEAGIMNLLSVKGEHDTQEWETVGESAAASQGHIGYYRDMGGNVGRSGSSIAGVTDTDSVSQATSRRLPFSSTDRIMQHPAHMGFSHEYRQREIPNVSIPVLLPSYKQPITNGFQVNSSRIMNNPYQKFMSMGASKETHLPMPETHRNPFNTTPPFVDTSKPTESTMTTSSTQDEVRRDAPKENAGGPVAEWMTNVTKPLPAFLPDSRVRDDPTSGARPNSYALVFSDAIRVDGDEGHELQQLRENGKAVSSRSTNSDDTPILVNNKSPAQMLTRLSFQSNPHTPPQPQSSRSKTRVPKFQRKFPGSFYDNLQSRYQSSPGTPSRVSRRVSISQEQLTGGLRPLTLSVHNRPNTLIDEDFINDSQPPRDQQEPDVFQYRSPLGGLRTRKWRDLYTTEQLQHIEDLSIQSERGEASTLAHQSFNNQDGNASIDQEWVKIAMTPRLISVKRTESPIIENTAERKKKLSRVLLVLAFPFFLPFYGWGKMDRIMKWWTDGEITTIRQDHKRFARWATGAVLLMIAIGLAVGLVFHFKP